MPPNVRQISQTGGVGEWYASLPPVTKWHATAALALMLGTSFMQLQTSDGRPYGLDYWLYFDWKEIFKLQVWRLVTSFVFLGGLGINSFMHLLWLVMYGPQLEKSTTFGASSADYIWMYMFCAIAMLVLRVVPLFGYSFFGYPFVTMIIYMWSRYNATARVTLFGLITIQGFYLPFAFMAVDAISQKTYIPGGFFRDLMGILAGHLYYFLREIEPMRSGRRWISTPAFVSRLAHRLRIGQVPLQQVATGGNPSSAAFRSFQGRGRRLTD